MEALSDRYYSSDNDQDKQQVEMELQKIKNNLPIYHKQMIKFISSPDTTAEESNYLTQKFNQVQGLIKNLSELCYKNQKPSEINSDALLPPRQPLEAPKLNQKQENLQQQLLTLNEAINQAEDLAQLPDDEVQDQRQIVDKTQQELNETHQQLDHETILLKNRILEVQLEIQRLLKENNQLKQENFVINQELSNLQIVCQQNKQKQQQLFIERENNQQDCLYLQSEQARVDAQFEREKKAYEFEVNKHQNYIMESDGEIKLLQDTKQQLETTILEIQGKIKEFEDLHMDDAGIEIAKTTKTMEVLQGKVDTLKTKLEEKRVQESQLCSTMKDVMGSVQLRSKIL